MPAASSPVTTIWEQGSPFYSSVSSTRGEEATVLKLSWAISHSQKPSRMQPAPWPFREIARQTKEKQEPFSVSSPPHDGMKTRDSCGVRESPAPCHVLRFPWEKREDEAGGPKRQRIQLANPDPFIAGHGRVREPVRAENDLLQAVAEYITHSRGLGRALICI